MTDSDTLLRTEGLTKSFAGFIAVREVSLDVRRGTIHALIGPNGAGKTTFFNLLTRFLPPTHGRIFYKGRDITKAAPFEVARMGVVRSFQISAVFPHMSVLDNVRVALQRFLDLCAKPRKIRREDRREDHRTVGFVGVGCHWLTITSREA